MALDAAGAAEALRVILAALPGVAGAQIGVPESIGPRVWAYVTAGSQTTTKISMKRIQRDARFLLTLAYRLDGGESTAETTLMAAVDALVMAVSIGLHLGVDGAAGQVVGIDAGLADTPEYVARAAKEFREYPVLVTVQQFAEYA